MIIRIIILYTYDYTYNYIYKYLFSAENSWLKLLPCGVQYICVQIYQPCRDYDLKDPTIKIYQ